MTEERFLLQAQGYEEKVAQEVPEVKMLAIFGLLPFARWMTFGITTDMVRWVVNRDGYGEPREPPVEPPVEPPSEAEISAAVAEAIQAVVIPYNAKARLAQDGAARGLAPASDEFYQTVKGVQVVAQAWRDPAEAGAQPEPYPTQHIGWRVVGEWGEGQAHWVTRRN